jgi:hypothetical protein
MLLGRGVCLVSVNGPLNKLAHLVLRQYLTHTCTQGCSALRNGCKIERLVQPDLFSDSQYRITGVIFSAVQNLERLRIINGSNAFTERQLKDFELCERTADDPPVLSMLHLAVFPKRGAQNTHWAFTGGLYFKMQITMRRMRGSLYATTTSICGSFYFICIATT